MTPTPSAPNKTGVFWTQFPATSLTGPDGNIIDWTDHRASHRAISRLFPPRLPGESGARRSTAGILYRLDVMAPDATPTVIVQSLVAPELTPALSRSTEVSRRAWDLSEGDRITLRVAVNPIRRTTRHYVDAEKAQTTPPSNTGETVPLRTAEGRRDRTFIKQTASVVPVDKSQAWLLGKFGASLTDVQFVNHFRDKLRSGPQNLVVDTFDLTATVGLAEEFDELRLKGLGRAKAYGCGLITAAHMK